MSLLVADLKSASTNLFLTYKKYIIFILMVIVNSNVCKFKNKRPSVRQDLSDKGAALPLVLISV